MEQYVPVSQAELGEFRSHGDPDGTIALPVRDVINTSTFLSVLGMMNQLPRDGINVDVVIVKGNILTLQRNALLQRMRGDWLLFIDDDMVWEQDAVSTLVRSMKDLEEAGHEVDVLGALCFRRAKPYQPTLYVRDGDHGPYNFLEDWEGRYIEVDATGMAFAIVTKRCLERIAGSEMPPFEARLKFDRHPDFFRWQGALGEDLRFCQDVRAAGGHILIDTSVEIRHVGEAERGYDDFLRSLAEREPEVLRVRKAVNTKMGLPTLTPREARKRLRERP